MRFPLALLLLIACGGDPAAPADSATDGGDTDTDPVADTDPPEPTGDTWDSFAAGFMETYCVSCHDASPKDFALLDDVVAFADPIRCGVSPIELEGCEVGPNPGQFPAGAGPKPSDEERERLVAWIDAGMP